MFLLKYMNTTDIFKMVKDKLAAVELLTKKLEEIAEEDEEVTDEELILLNTIKLNIDQYKTIVETALNHEVITEEDLENIHTFEKRILHTANEAALQDGFISDDERYLLDNMIDYMTEIQDISEKLK